MMVLLCGGDGEDGEAASHELLLLSKGWRGAEQLVVTESLDEYVSRRNRRSDVLTRPKGMGNCIVVLDCVDGC